MTLPLDGALPRGFCGVGVWLGFDAQKKRPRSCDARAVGFSGNLLLGFFEGGLGGCEACHGDAER